MSESKRRRQRSMLESKRERERLVLYRLAASGPMNSYQMIRELREIWSGTILRADLRRFERNDLIDTKKRKAKRGPNRASYHTLTRLGLIVLISSLRGHEIEGVRKGLRIRSSISLVARNCRPLLPEIFEIWSNLVERGLEERATKGLEDYCDGAYQEEVRRLMGLDRKENWSQLFDKFLLGPLEGIPDRYTPRWRQALIDDSVLHEAAKKVVQLRIGKVERLRKTLGV